MDTSQSRHLNQRIDGLLAGGLETAELMAAAKSADPVALAERIRRRAARQVRLQPARAQTILDIRDHLILAVYACALPEDAYSGWCDGSSVATDSAARNGIGAMLTDAGGTVLAEAANRIPPTTAPFETEIAALERLLELALAHGAHHLRAHTDCPALVQLWQRRPHDHRLVTIRRLSRPFERFEVKAVPRQHNQPAHRLAQAAVRDTAA